MQEVYAGLSFIVIGSGLLVLIKKQPRWFTHWIDMKILRKIIGERNTIIILTIVSIAFIGIGIYLLLFYFV